MRSLSPAAIDEYQGMTQETRAVSPSLFLNINLPIRSANDLPYASDVVLVSKPPSPSLSEIESIEEDSQESKDEGDSVIGSTESAYTDETPSTSEAINPAPVTHNLFFSDSPNPKTSLKQKSKINHMCSKCDKTFLTKGSLDRHNNEKHLFSVPYYTCELCQYTTNRKSSYKIHFKSKKHIKNSTCNK